MSSLSRLAAAVGCEAHGVELECLPDHQGCTVGDSEEPHFLHAPTSPRRSCATRCLPRTLTPLPSSTASHRTSSPRSGSCSNGPQTTRRTVKRSSRSRPRWSPKCSATPRGSSPSPKGSTPTGAASPRLWAGYCRHRTRRSAFSVGRTIGPLFSSLAVDLR